MSLVAGLPRMPRLSLPRWAFVMLGAVLLALLVWLVGPLVAIAGHAPLAGWLARLIVIALIALGVGGYYGIRQLRRRRTNDALVDELASPRTAAPPQDDLSAEDVKAMEERAAKALELMRGQRVGAQRELVYELPWYVIIGPPGAGKTTALHNCGLHFPVAQEVGAAPIRGVGGTRTTDWWFTDRAVLIDTAGRYTTQDSHEAADSKAWNGLLDLLKRYRPRQPLTGVIVALPVPDLLAADDAEVTAHAKAVRARINEIAQKFGVRTPVYILLTKADLLAGFTEFFDDMDAQTREQVWGHTFTLRTDKSAQAEAAGGLEAFDVLIDRLNDRLLARVQAERDIVRRGLIFGFPQQVAALRGPLEALLQIIGRDTRFEPAPLVRGFYLTSGTQYGRPIDRLLASLSAKFGVTATATGGGVPGKGRSYFLRDLLDKVMFPEAALAGRDPLTEQRRQRLKLMIAGAGAALLVLLSIGWLVGYLSNAKLIRELGEHASKLEQDAHALPQGEISDSDLTAILPVLDEARGLPFASTAPKPLRAPGFSFGLGQTGALRPQVEGAYRNLLNRMMLPRLILGVEDRLRALVQAPQASGASDTRSEVYGLLRIYLMLGRAPGAPMLHGQIEGWFANAWSEQFPGQEDDPLRADLSAHLSSLLAGPLDPPALDGGLITAARAEVASLSPGERVYSRLLSDPNLTGLQAYTLQDAPGVGSSGLFQLKSGKPLSTGVPGMFRRQAFYGQVLTAIGKAATESADEGWVMGQPNQGTPLSEAGRIKDGVLIAYLSDFTRRWDDFIGDIGVSGRYPPDERIRRALQPPSPVKLLIQSLATETNLTPPGAPGRTGLAGAVLRTSSLFSRRIYGGVNRMNQGGPGQRRPAALAAWTARRRDRALSMAAGADAGPGRPLPDRRRAGFAEAGRRLRPGRQERCGHGRSAAAAREHQHRHGGDRQAAAGHLRPAAGGQGAVHRLRHLLHPVAEPGRQDQHRAAVHKPAPAPVPPDPGGGVSVLRRRPADVRRRLQPPVPAGRADRPVPDHQPDRPDRHHRQGLEPDALGPGAGARHRQRARAAEGRPYPPGLLQARRRAAQRALPAGAAELQRRPLGGDAQRRRRARGFRRQ